MLDIAAWILENALCLFAYISGQSSFPKTLSPEEERMYLERLAQGDTKARDVLIERNLRLVAHVIKKYTNTGKETEDLISIGTIGLIKGVSTYNMDKGTQLATYVARCIENAILSLRLFLTNRRKTALPFPGSGGFGINSATNY